MFSQVSVCSRKVCLPTMQWKGRSPLRRQGLPQKVPPPTEGKPPQKADLPQEADPPEGRPPSKYNQQSGGTYPTGMHDC